MAIAWEPHLKTNGEKIEIDFSSFPRSRVGMHILIVINHYMGIAIEIVIELESFGERLKLVDTSSVRMQGT